MSLPDSTWMSRVSQRKLSGNSAVLTLHRWVLLKNTIITADDVLPPSSSSASVSSHSSSSAGPSSSVGTPPYEYSSSPADEEVFVFPDADIFVFPDAASLVSAAAESVSAEAAWLDSLLEELEDDDYSEEEPMASPTSVIGDTESRFALDGSTHPISTCSLAVSQPIPIPNLTATASASSSLSSDSLCNCTTPPPTPTSLPSTPRLLDDLPFFAPDGVDDSSDDESDGPETPLFLSTLAHTPALGDAAADHEPAVVFSEPDSYFVYPTDPAPIVPRSQGFQLQEC